MGDDVILRTSGLGKRFGARWAVRDLDLEVRRGEVFGFLGPNGAGKSTTIRMIMTLVRPTRGTVELFGRPHSVRRRAALGRVGSLVEQADFYLHLSARRNLEIVAGVRGGVPAGELDRVLRIAGLGDRAGDQVKTFSHGMKQRLGIAQALLASPELVVLDEPTTGLDPQGMKDVRDLVVRLAREEGTTVFISSHLLHEIEQVATTVAIINEGRLAAQGTVGELLAGRQVRVRIDVTPAARACELLAALPYVVDPVADDEGLDASVPREKLAEVNRLLVQTGLEVRALIPRRSLEDVFLSITGGT
jgi:ABC-2 type transport system ATP-binding protein